MPGKTIRFTVEPPKNAESKDAIVTSGYYDNADLLWKGSLAHWYSTILVGEDKARQWQTTQAEAERDKRSARAEEGSAKDIFNMSKEICGYLVSAIRQ